MIGDQANGSTHSATDGGSNTNATVDDAGSQAGSDTAAACAVPPIGTGGVTGATDTVILATGPRGVCDIAIDADNVYWLPTGMAVPTDYPAAVMSVPKVGGTAVTLFSTTSRIYHFALDETHIYLAHHDYANQIVVPATSGTSGPDAILRVPKSGGAAETVADGLHWALAVTVDDTFAYFTDDSEVQPNTAVIRRVPKAGGAATTLIDGLQGAFSLGVDETWLYYAEGNAFRVMKMAKAGGSPVELATGPWGTSTLALDASSAYFGACQGGCSQQSVLTVPKCGGETVSLLTRDTNGGDNAIAVGRDHLFWAGRQPPDGNSAGALVMVPRVGGSAVELLSGPDILALTVESDESAVYWVDFDTGEVGRTNLR
jgi:hypothetical protein